MTKVINLTTKLKDNASVKDLRAALQVIRTSIKDLTPYSHLPGISFTLDELHNSELLILVELGKFNED